MTAEGAQSKSAWRMPSAVGGASFAIYFLTAAREPIFGDGLEFVAAAAIGGVPHPTGYPLLMLLLAPFSQGESAYFLSALLCALFAAGAAALTASMARSLIESVPAVTRFSTGERMLPAVLGLMVAFSASLWRTATVVEAYGLNALLMTSIIVAAAPWKREPLGAPRVSLSALFLGLAASNHLTSLSLAPLVAWRVIQSARAETGWRSALFASGSLAAGLLPYVSVPLRASGNPAINWGNASTWQGFQWLVTGGDYKLSQFMQASPGQSFTADTYLPFAFGRLVDLVVSLGAEPIGGSGPGSSAMVLLLAGILGVGLLLLIVWGARTFCHVNRPATVLLLVAGALQSVLIFTYNITDIADYYPGVWVVLIPFLIVGTREALAHSAEGLGYLEDEGLAGRARFVLVALVVVALGANWKAADRSREVLCAVWIDRLLEATPQNAILMTHSDYDTYGAWYAQHATGRRPDVLIVGANFLRLEWYESMLPNPADDPFGREVSTEPGSFTRFGPRDHAEMLARRVVDPNLGKVPVVTTTIPESWNDPMFSLLPRLYRMEQRALLLEVDEMEYLRSMHPTIPLPVLSEFVERREPEAFEP